MGATLFALLFSVPHPSISTILHRLWSQIERYMAAGSSTADQLLVP